jgi:hypothetical protein
MDLLRGVEMGVFISGSDDSSWHMERDPMSRPIEATSADSGPIALPRVVRDERVRAVVQSAETP